MVMFRSCLTRSTRSSRSSLVCASTEPNGSSISSSTGSQARARASATRCCIPPDSCHGYRAETPARPTAARDSSATCRRRARFRRVRRSGRVTLSRTVSHG
jgi:hypothetical protein